MRHLLRLSRRAVAASVCLSIHPVAGRAMANHLTTAAAHSVHSFTARRLAAVASHLYVDIASASTGRLAAATCHRCNAVVNAEAATLS